MLNNGRTSRLLSTLLLLIVVAGATFVLINFTEIQAFPAILLALVVFFGTSLLITQMSLSRKVEQINNVHEGMADFESDINRRLLTLEASLSNSDRSSVSVPPSSSNSSKDAHSEILARLDALETQTNSGFERVSPTQISATSSKEKSKTDAVVAKPSSLSRINLKEALNSGNLSLHLQPIVGLPNRQPVHYEALMRLQMRNGDYLDAGQFLKIAEKGGLMPNIDKKVVFSAVRMLRTLEVLKKKAGLFCNISSDTLRDARAFREISNILQANISLSDSLVFEISQRQYRHLKTKEKDRLGKIADMGFSLSMDQVLDLRLDVDGLYKSGFRFIKISAGILLHASLDDNAPAAPSELSYVLGESDLTLIASEVERESEVMNLIDFGVGNAQGLAFAPPRPVKAELLQPIRKTSEKPVAQPSPKKPTAKTKARSKDAAAV